MKQIIVLMGPSGAGKSTLGAALSAQTGWLFLEGDDFHPETNRTKQAAGEPLTDADRAAWIDAIVEATNRAPAPQQLLACSALTPYVRDRLVSEVAGDIVWVLLLPNKAELKHRLETRADHFMSASLLDNQLETLTVPDGAIRVEAAPVPEQCEQILAALSHHKA